MWIIKLEGKYNTYVGLVDAMGWEGTTDRDEAKRFTKQEAKDFMAKHSITGSIIPA